MNVWGRETLFITVSRGRGGRGDERAILFLSLPREREEKKGLGGEKEKFISVESEAELEEMGLKDGGGEEVLLLCKEEETTEKYKFYHCWGRIRRKADEME